MHQFCWTTNMTNNDYKNQLWVRQTSNWISVLPLTNCGTLSEDFHLWASVSSFVHEGKSVISTTRGHWSDELMLVDYCWAHRKCLITCYLWFRHRWSSRYGWEIGRNPSRLFFPWSQMQSFFSRPFKSLVTLHCIFWMPPYLITA